MIKTHSLFYKLPHEPFVVFDIIQGTEKPVRPRYAEIVLRCMKYDFVSAALLHEGTPISVNDALDVLGNSGLHGCQSPPEGVVYRYERDGTFEMSAKYVSNLNVGGDFMDDESAYNEWRDGGRRI
jgi:hypothetical protein